MNIKTFPWGAIQTKIGDGINTLFILLKVSCKILTLLTYNNTLIVYQIFLYNLTLLTYDNSLIIYRILSLI